jgi:hypothetical protein
METVLQGQWEIGLKAVNSELLKVMLEFPLPTSREDYEPGGISGGSKY